MGRTPLGGVGGFPFALAPVSFGSRIPFFEVYPPGTVNATKILFYVSKDFSSIFKLEWNPVGGYLV